MLGGVVGEVVVGVMLYVFGFMGGMLLLLIVFVIGLLLYFCFLWLLVVECVGGVILFVVNVVKLCCEVECDCKFGEVVVVCCEGKVEEECVCIEDYELVMIVLLVVMLVKFECVECEC